jgi:membrane protein YdbS with pleckstrin-like domain
MGIILVVLLLAIVLGGLGFAIHVLWWIALAVLAVWLIGFMLRVGEGVGGRRRRWYRWLPAARPRAGRAMTGSARAGQRPAWPAELSPRS